MHFLVLMICVAQVDRPSAQTPATPPPESVELRLARAELGLAEANLKRVRQMNQRAARTVPASIVAEFEQDLALARLQLDLAGGGADDDFKLWIDRAETHWKTADRNWKSSVAVNQTAPGTIASLDVERLRLRAEVARLQFERGRELSTGSQQAQVQWQIELMNTELQRMREDSRLRNPNPLSYPVWRW